MKLAKNICLKKSRFQKVKRVFLIHFHSLYQLTIYLNENILELILRLIHRSIFVTFLDIYLQLLRDKSYSLIYQVTSGDF